MVLHDLGVLLEGNQLPGWLPLVVVIVMIVALAWLWGSMRTHLKRADYPDEPEAAEGAADGASPATPDSATQA